MSRTGYLIISNGLSMGTKLLALKDKAFGDSGKRFPRLANISSVKLTCFRQSIILISVLIPYYCKGALSKIAWF